MYWPPSFGCTNCGEKENLLYCLLATKSFVPTFGLNERLKFITKVEQSEIPAQIIC